MPAPTTKYFIVISFLACLFSSCKNDQNITREYTYFGGEIINPNSSYVILSKDHDHKDTILLDRNNRFLHKIKDLEEGIYSFRHSPETQIVLLEKGDSILIRLNTLEFDESLVFTGIGARKNNFLVDMFLQNEQERKKLNRSGFQLSHHYFKKYQDSLLQSKIENHANFSHKYKLSNLAKKLTEASCNFDYYARHELYFYLRQISDIDKTEKLPESFFDYRNTIDLNDDDLKRLYAYNRYMNYYFRNLSLSNRNNAYSKTAHNKQMVSDAIFILNSIDSIITHPYTKNNLLKRTAINFLLESQNDIDSDMVLKNYLSKNTNPNFKKELKNLAWSIAKLQPNKIIPNQNLISTDNKNIQLSSLFNKPITALYFWSTESKDHYIKAHEKVAYLTTLYPEIDFIAINTDDEQTSNWLKTIKRHQYDLDFEYKFKNPKCSYEELVINYRNKVILVDNEGKIINAKANLFAPIFEKQLMQYTQLSALEK